MRILIGGSSGLVGTALGAKLAGQTHEVVRLVRRPARGGDEIFWDPARGQLDAAALEGFDAVVHLGGAGIGDKRWSEERKREISDSRIDSTSLLAETLAELREPPGLYINCSAIGFYGDQGDELLKEYSRPTASWRKSYLTELCAQWEAATAPAARAGIRTIVLRLGVVLAKDALFLKRQLPLFRLGLGGRLGAADRWVSWIGLEDTVGAIVWLLEGEAEAAADSDRKKISGPVNLCAPNPVTNQEFTKTLGKVLRRPTVLPVPKLAPSLLLGKELINCLTESTRVVPDVLESRGYEFVHPELTDALRAALGKR